MWFWGLTALAAATAWRVFRPYPAPPAGLRVLGAREYAFVSAAAQAMFPPGGALAPSGASVPGYVDGFVAERPAQLRLLMRLLFFLCEHATLVFPAPLSGSRLGGMRRFTGLSVEARGAYLDGWGESRLAARRLVFTSLRAILTLAYLGDPAVVRELGLAPKAIDTPVCQADLLWPRAGLARERIAYGPGDVTAPSAGVPLAPDAPLHPDYAPPRDTA